MTDMAHALLAARSENDGEEESEETQHDGVGVVTATPEDGAELPRARVRRRVAHVPVSVFGAVPERCTAWGIKRASLGGRWEVLSHGDGTVKGQEWPLDALTIENVRAWWGPGKFRVMWFEPTEGGGRKFMCLGRVVEFEPEAPPVVVRAAPAPAASGGGDMLSGLDATLRVLDVIEGRADAKIEGMHKLALVIAGGGASRGISGDDLLRILREERQASAETTAAAIAAAVEPLKRQIAELSEDEGEDAASLAAAAAKPLIRGKGTLATALNFASENPDLVKAGLPIVAGAFSALAALFQQSQSGTAEAVAAKREAAASPVARPRAEPRAAAHPDPFTEPTANAWEVREPPKSAAPTPTPAAEASASSS